MNDIIYDFCPQKSNNHKILLLHVIDLQLWNIAIKRKLKISAGIFVGRGDPDVHRDDFVVPNDARYRAALHPTVLENVKIPDFKNSTKK